jgi:two-component system sensor histidine kinase/response regulator
MSTPRPPTKRSSAELITVAGRVLLIEDSPVNQEITVLLLQNMGYVVDVASTGNDALKVLDGMPYDVILIDRDVADMNEIDTTKAIRSLNDTTKHTPIIVISTDPVGVNGSTDINDRLAKPIDREELAVKLDQWISQEV